MHCIPLSHWQLKVFLFSKLNHWLTRPSNYRMWRKHFFEGIRSCSYEWSFMDVLIRSSISSFDINWFGFFLSHTQVFFTRWIVVDSFDWIFLSWFHSKREMKLFMKHKNWIWWVCFWFQCFISELPNFQSFVIGDDAFWSTSILNFCSLLLFFVVWLELPRFNSFITGKRAFFKTYSITLSGPVVRFWLVVDVPFEKGVYTVAPAFNTIFYEITADSIKADTCMKSLKTIEIRFTTS